MRFGVGATMAMGLILSPEALMVLGNSVGGVGFGALVALAVAALVALGTVYSYAMLARSVPSVDSEAGALQVAFGALPALVVPLSARLLVMVSTATLMLATAGYVFNEVLVYWFPNLGLSFCLLGVLLLLNLLGRRVALVAQVGFLGVVVVGLVGLSVIALTGLGRPVAASVVSPTAGALVWQSSVAVLGLFIGFDLARFTGCQPSQTRSMTMGIVLASMVLCLWGSASAMYVPLAKLADTTVPHMIAARRILGQPGRIIIGVVVLAATCGAVNALLLGCSRMLTGMAQHGLLPAMLAWKAERAPLPLLLLAAGPALMMLEGMAGEPITTVWMRAGLVCWLLLYAMVHGAAITLRYRVPEPPPAVTVVWQVLSLVVLVLGSAVLVWFDAERGALLACLGVVIVGLTLLGGVWLGLCRRRAATVSGGEDSVDNTMQ